MLAAECAWAILNAEHSQTRQLLAELQHSLPGSDADDYRERAAAAIRAIEKLQAFEATIHRPKGLMMLSTLRGRASETDALLDELELESEHCAELLSRANSLLVDTSNGDRSAVSPAAQLLAKHRQMVRRHLHKEDTILRSRTAELLTSEEWAAVASSMSQEMKMATARMRRRRRNA